MSAIVLTLASLGAITSGLALESIADSIFGLPNAREDVHERLDEFLNADNAGEQGSFDETDDGRKHVPEDPAEHTIDAVAAWLCAVRPVVSVTVRLYAGTGSNAYCDGGATVTGMDNRAEEGVRTELRNFLADARQSPDMQALSLMVTVSSLDKDDLVEAKAATLVARAVKNELAAGEGGPDLSREIIVPRDCEEPDDIAPHTVMFKIAPGTTANDDTIQLDEVVPTGKLCNLLVTGETGSGKSTVCNVVAQCMVDQFLFPIKQNSTGSTVIRSVKKLHDGVSYRIFDTPGFEDASGADSVTACELWNLTREIEYVNCVAHVTSHSTKRPGVIDTNGLNKYLRVIGEAARRRLFLIVTHEAGENPRRTVQNCVNELTKRTGIPRDQAEKRVVTVDLSSAREIGTHPSADIAKNMENLETARSIMDFCRSGTEDTEHAINNRIAFQNLSENPNGPFAEAMRNEIITDHLDAWRARTTRLGAVYEAQVVDVEDNAHKATVTLGGGSRLLGGKKIFTFGLHFTREEDKSEFIKDAESFTDSEAIRQWFKQRGLTPMVLGQEETESNFFVQYETFYYKVVDKDALHNVQWVQRTVSERGNRATMTVMWDRFEKILKNFILSPPADDAGNGLLDNFLLH